MCYFCCLDSTNPTTHLPQTQGSFPALGIFLPVLADHLQASADVSTSTSRAVETDQSISSNPHRFSLPEAKDKRNPFGKSYWDGKKPKVFPTNSHISHLRA